MQLKSDRRYLVSPAAELKLTERSVIEKVLRQPVCIRNRTQRLESLPRAISLSNGDGPVKGDNRGRANGDQSVIERHNFFPVRILNSRGGRMDYGDRSFNVIFGEFGAFSRKLQKLKPLVYEGLIPQGRDEPASEPGLNT